MTIKFSDITGGGIPYGNTAGRPQNPGTGKLYSNGETQRIELYTSSGSWENIVQEVPGVSSISGQYLESNQSNTITIYGTNFVSGATAYAIGTNAVQVAATSTTFNSLVQLTAVFTGLTSANEPYDIKVVNPSNLFGILPDGLYINNILTWQTAAGSLGVFGDNVSISVSATATDSDSTITYSLASGSSLPTGVTLNSTTGLISGTTPDVVSNTTYTFTINASDGSNPEVPRTFSFTVNAAPVWSTQAGSLGTFDEQTSISVTVAATDVSETISYSLASGSSLPTGITLNSSTGVISGTLPDILVDTTYSFTINASDGLNTIPRTFNITSLAFVSMETLVVAGGGSGASSSGAGSGPRGGGGAGGLIYTTLSKTIGSQMLVTVGNGGTAPSPGEVDGNNGSNSIFDTLVALGGGGGASNAGQPGKNGGSGGGGCYSNGAGTALQPSSSSGGFGNNGGTSRVSSNDGAGGGGGAGSVGGTPTTPDTGGNGGSGRQYSITGTSLFYAAGGGGGGYPTGSNIGIGGSGIGGNGGGGSLDATAGAANTGSGGGGRGSANAAGAAGGSGVVIIAYPNTKPALSNIPGTLTYDQPTREGYRVYRFTAGTGTITF